MNELKKRKRKDCDNTTVGDWCNDEIGADTYDGFGLVYIGRNEIGAGNT